VGPVLQLSEQEIRSLRVSAGGDAHRQYGEGLTRWMGEVFPVKPNKMNKLLIMHGSAEGDTGSPCPVGGDMAAQGPSRPGTDSTSEEQQRANAAERDANNKFKHSLCRPVNRIWGMVPGEGRTGGGAGGLRQGALRWGPVVHEYIQVDADNVLTRGSQDLLTADRPASTARRLNEAAARVSEVRTHPFDPTILFT